MPIGALLGRLLALALRRRQVIAHLGAALACVNAAGRRHDGSQLTRRMRSARRGAKRGCFQLEEPGSVLSLPAFRHLESLVQLATVVFVGDERCQAVRVLRALLFDLPGLPPRRLPPLCALTISDRGQFALHECAKDSLLVRVPRTRVAIERRLGAYFAHGRRGGELLRCEALGHGEPEKRERFSLRLARRPRVARYVFSTPVPEKRGAGFYA